VVNVNPLYTPRETEFQLKDSGAKVVIVLANFASLLQGILQNTSIEKVIVTEVGDLLNFPKGLVVNFALRYVKKLVPKFELPHAIGFREALLAGAGQSFRDAEIGREDLAFLQYTGGTTGVSKGAMLSHGNIIANMLQMEAWIRGAGIVDGAEIVVTPLPLYHIISLTVNCFACMQFGCHNILITNPKDIPAFVSELRKYPFTIMSGVNTLYNALLQNDEFRKLDFKSLKLVVGGGMAVQRVVAERWKEVTGIGLVEGYGLTETSPLLCANRTNKTEVIGSIGLPVPNTDISIRDDDGKEVAQGEPGELCARGPQVMQGYWNRPDETEKVMLGDWFRTGDIATMDEKGFFRIVDRKKDMILVSGFNVYPNEIEDVIAAHPGVLEVAALGVPDDKSGEAVKVFIVKKNPELTTDELKKFCREKLTGYKNPKYFEFRTELPKSNVGKILRRMLRDEKK